MRHADVTQNAPLAHLSTTATPVATARIEDSFLTLQNCGGTIHTSITSTTTLRATLATGLEQVPFAPLLLLGSDHHGRHATPPDCSLGSLPCPWDAGRTCVHTRRPFPAPRQATDLRYGPRSSSWIVTIREHPSEFYTHGNCTLYEPCRLTFLARSSESTRLPRTILL